MRFTAKTIHVLSLALFMAIIGTNSVFANANFRERTTKIYPQGNYGYSSSYVVYPNQSYESYYIQQRQNENFVRNVYFISKIAEENPDVKYKYTVTNVVYL